MRTAHIALCGVTKRYADHVVLDRVDLIIRPGEKVGVIGDNGAGKSTLLKLLAGVEAPDNGEVRRIAPGGVGHLAQALDLPAEATVQDAVDLALADLRELEAQMRSVEVAIASGQRLEELLGVYSALVERYEASDGYDADARVDLMLHRLGLPGLDRTRTLGTLSGGERSRLALAATLAAQPEVLLLDEPTNDLDDQAVEWLEEHLRAHRGTVVAVTHDRVFLERLTSTILEVEERSVTRYGNGYDGFLAAKAAERRRRLREYDEWRQEIARSRRLVEANAAKLDEIPRKMELAVFAAGPFRARGRGHGAMSRIRNLKGRLDRLTDNPVAPPPEPLTFVARLEESGQNSDVELTGVRVGTRLHVESLRIEQGERLLVTGPNGAGKTTLMRVLAGELSPDTGTVRRPARVGHLNQDGVRWPCGLTLVQAFALGRTGELDDAAESLLSLGLFDTADLRKRVEELSFGQRRRIELARLVTEPVDLLLLDEPTNHLSPLLVEQLEEALASYRGALVVVTHDRRLRERFTGSHLALEAGQLMVC
ncbi:TlrC/CarA/OleB/SrmB family ABC-F type ribosomal protection protein [Kribbella sp. NPDC051952]|uniref:TlrC/CarA/OleB/SrmB family ABC-F type ribosomal protection protein n=1 Tax=Kribbella sp. NPDC051952 TaxID=3154851 RepID=UPI00342E7996